MVYGIKVRRDRLSTSSWNGIERIQKKSICHEFRGVKSTIRCERMEEGQYNWMPFLHRVYIDHIDSKENVLTFVSPRLEASTGNQMLITTKTEENHGGSECIMYEDIWARV